MIRNALNQREVDARQGYWQVQVATQLIDFIDLQFSVYLPLQEAGQTKVHMQVKVDPGLIHGVTIEIGDKFIDYSVATQLKKLAVLLDVGV